MKVLSLDGFDAGAKRQLVIGGKEYPVEEMTVENFIITTKTAERLKDETSVAVQIEATVDMICRSVPTIERKVLGKLSLVQLQTVVAFVRGDADDMEEPKASDDSNEKAAAQGK